MQDMGHSIPSPLRTTDRVEKRSATRLPYCDRERRHPQPALETFRRPIAAREEQVRVQNRADQRDTDAKWPLQPRRDQGGYLVAVERGAYIRIRSAAAGRAGMAEQTNHSAAERTYRGGGIERAGRCRSCKLRRIHLCPKFVHPDNTTCCQVYSV